MGDEARHAVVAALVRLAESADYRDRADAGRALASFAEMGEAAGALRALLLDARDTFVTFATADALLRREDAAGLGAVAGALAVADDNHADYLRDAVVDVFGIFAGRRDTAVRICAEMVDGGDVLRDILLGINPVLYPPEKAGES